MSMLSSMTEKMRETADKVERFERRNSDWLWRDATTITRAVVELRDAANTIDRLRRTCNDLQRDYDNLRNAMWDRANARAIDFMKEDELRATCADLYDHIDELKALVRDMYTCIDHMDGLYNFLDCRNCKNDGDAADCDFEGRMESLGVEVEP